MCTTLHAIVERADTRLCQDRRIPGMRARVRLTPWNLGPFDDSRRDPSGTSRRSPRMYDSQEWFTFNRGLRHYRVVASRANPASGLSHDHIYSMRCSLIYVLSHSRDNASAFSVYISGHCERASRYFPVHEATVESKLYWSIHTEREYYIFFLFHLKLF